MCFASATSQERRRWRPSCCQCARAASTREDREADGAGDEEEEEVVEGANSDGGEEEREERAKGRDILTWEPGHSGQQVLSYKVSQCYSAICEQ